MPRSAASLVIVALATLALSCAGNPLGPVDEQSLVLAFTFESPSHCDIVLASLDGRSRRIQNVCGSAEAWSPDGKRIAFEKEGGEAAPPSVWIINADGSGEVKIPGGTGLAAPDWSPDGTRIAAIYLGSGFMDVMRADGSQGYVLAGAGQLGFDRPSWSPDGSEILFARSDTLWVVNANSGMARVQCVPGLQQMMGARWSPDGARISVDARTPNRFGVYVMNADCSDQRLLADGSIDGGWASWSADGSQLAYASALGDGTTLDVFVVPSDGSGAPRNLTNNRAGLTSTSPDWARAR